MVSTRQQSAKQSANQNANKATSEKKMPAKPTTSETGSVRTRSQKTAEKRRLQEAMNMNHETPTKIMAIKKTENQPRKMSVPVIRVDSPNSDDVIFVAFKPAESDVSKPAESDVSKPAESDVSKPAESGALKPTESGSSGMPTDNTALIPLTHPAARHLISLDKVISKLPPTEHKGLPKISVNFQDLLTLQENTDLNDNVVNFMIHLELIRHIDEETANQIHIFDPLFFKKLVTVRNKETWYTNDELNREEEKQLKSNAEASMSWLRKINIFEKKMLLIPVCQGKHWMLLLIINPFGCLVKVDGTLSDDLPCRIVFFDSYFDDENRNNHFRHVANCLLKTAWTNKKVLDVSKQFAMDRILFSTPTNIPKQDNGFDCGVFVSHFSAGVLSKFEDIVSLPATEPLNWNHVSPDANIVMRDKPRHDVITRILQLAASGTRLSIYINWLNLGFGDHN